MKDDVETLKTILKNCKNIDYDLTKCNDYTDFLDSDTIQRSCVFSMIQIGEFVKRLTDKFVSEHDEVNWSLIARYRDLLAHNYAKINPNALWQTITEDIPELEKSIEKMLSEQNDD